MPTRPCSGPSAMPSPRPAIEVARSRAMAPRLLRVARYGQAGARPDRGEPARRRRLHHRQPAANGGRSVDAHAGHPAARRERGRASRQGPSIRRRRLPDQAVPPGRADGPDAQPAGPLQTRRAVHGADPADGVASPRRSRRWPRSASRRGWSSSTARRAAWARPRSRSTPRSPCTRSSGSSVCLIDANLQFGDHRVFLDLGLDRMSVVDLATARRRPRPDPADPREARVRDRPAARAAVARDGRARHPGPPALHHQPDGERVRLHPDRRRQAARRGQPADHGRRRRDLRRHDRRPSVPEERPARPRDDRPSRLLRGQSQADPEPVDRVHRAST